MHNMIKILETRLSNIRKDKYQTLTISFQIKKEDYTAELEKELYDLMEQWSYWVLAFQEAQYAVTKDRNKLIQHLVVLMNKYSEEKWVDIEDLKSELYRVYNVKSRSELRIDQLEEQIEVFKNGLLYD